MISKKMCFEKQTSDHFHLYFRDKRKCEETFIFLSGDEFRQEGCDIFEKCFTALSQLQTERCFLSFPQQNDSFRKMKVRHEICENLNLATAFLSKKFMDKI